MGTSTSLTASHVSYTRLLVSNAAVRALARTIAVSCGRITYLYPVTVTFLLRR